MAGVQSLDFEDLYMLIDILRSANDDGYLMQRLVKSLAYVKINRKFQTRRRSLICLFAHAFISRNSTEKLKELFQNRLVDPAFSESPTLMMISTLLLCHDCILLANSIVECLTTEAVMKVIECSNCLPIGKDNSSKCSYRLPTYLDVVKCPFNFAVFVEIVVIQASSADAFIVNLDAASNRIETEAKLRKFYQDCRKLSMEMKSSFLASLRLNPSYDGIYELQSFYLAYLKGCDEEEKV